MSCHTNLYGSGPFVYHFVNAHLKNLIGVQGTVAKHNTVIKIIRRTVKHKERSQEKCQ